MNGQHYFLTTSLSYQLSMAAAVAQSRAKRILIPFDHCDNIIVGVSEASMKTRVREAVAVLLDVIQGGC